MFIKNPLFQEGGELLLLNVFFTSFKKTLRLLLIFLNCLNLERPALTKSSTNTEYSQVLPETFFPLKGLRGTLWEVFCNCILIWHIINGVLNMISSISDSDPKISFKTKEVKSVHIFLHLSFSIFTCKNYLKFSCF